MRAWVFGLCLMLGCAALPPPGQVSAPANAPAPNTDLQQAHIYSVQFTRQGYQDVPPVIFLDAQEPLTLEWDELLASDATPAEYGWDLLPCDADWTPASLLPQEYYDGFLPERAELPQAGGISPLPYQHHSLHVPAPGYAFKRPGNYLLRVHERRQPDSVVVQRRLLVVERSAVLSVSVGAAALAQERVKRQQVDFTALLSSSGGAFLDPMQDVEAVVLRNLCWPEAVGGLRARFVENNRLDFRLSPGDAFEAGSEYRRADLAYPGFAQRRLLLPGLGDSIPYFILPADRPNLPRRAPLNPDFNGGFVLGGPTGLTHTTQGQYVMARFRLLMPEPLPGATVHVVGAFNGWQALPAHALAYDPARGMYAGDILLKQGLYDYAYAIRHADGRIDYRGLEGSYGQTENVFTVLLYAKPAGEPAARLIGIQQASSR